MLSKAFAITSILLSLRSSLVQVNAQLTGTVGPTNVLSTKTVTCSVLDYGGEVGSSDIGPAILDAFNECVLKNDGAVLYLPEGDYDMQTWVTLNKGSNWAFRMDGFITRTATTGGHMIIIENADDFEMYSSTSAGGFQGNGYECRNAGPRFLRIVTSTNWSLHDLIFVDSPEFHVIIQEGSNGEIYNLAIRGADIGGSDGIDISGDNHWVHDVEVTNRDECVTIKSPASNMLIEQVWCNQSGGCAFGSLGADTAISNIYYKNIYTNGGNQAMMFKSNGGNGTVDNVLLENFSSTGTAYGLDVNQYWSSMTAVDGDGVKLTNIEFKNWNGDVVNGVNRPPVQFICADGAPCVNMTLTDVNMWSETDKAIYKCESAYGTGACLQEVDSSITSYAASTSSYSQPTGYTSVVTMDGDLTAGFTSTASIPVPTIPSTFYPGLAQITPLAKNLASASAAVSVTASGQVVNAGCAQPESTPFAKSQEWRGHFRRGFESRAL
ncbi:pectin lyase-like protein [Stereum hirsutum FP-91666 SS1]|uniref:Pectin lyase-like protein n=1 Tax=Stereum hirsutum (strain FP-91666) TaxID=721885 RepID=R7RWV2_STEHR|nr:pectin lyase-like protein [Stereum hirsutum FP-91666 SS1]EIM79283.1 pectin lyase-like protein [Stereum hirsutum FP-91666 SS1]